VDVKYSRAEFEISSNGDTVKEFWLISDTSEGFAPNLQDGFPFDQYKTCNDLNSNGELDPGEATNVNTWTTKIMGTISLTCGLWTTLDFPCERKA
jgi:hypothetical protein